METGVTVTSLPLEILSNILTYLPLVDMLNAAKTCWNFRSAADVAYSHNHLSQIEKCISRNTEGMLTFCEVYQLLMSEYKFILGTWKIVSTCYGGFINVLFDGYKIIGNLYNVPPNPHIELPLSVTRTFVIQVNQSRQLQCVCYRGFNEPHLTNIDQFNMDGFRLQCPNPEMHAHKDGMKVEYSIWLCSELGMQKNSPELHALSSLHQEKFDVLSQQNAIDCLPMQLPVHKDNAVIQPGLFKGTYGAHGLELVLLTYDDETNQAIVTKITGDPNVPANQISLKADLSRRVRLSQAQQLELDEHTDYEILPPESDLEEQPFALPPLYQQRVHNVPTTCRARYKSKGQIAGPGFTYPVFVDCNWVVFDDNSFGHVWMTLSSFSMYSRVTETFTR